jgi:ferrochelatase
MARQGLESVDIMCPGFTSDCIETLEEINQEAREAFVHAGGKDYRFIPCLNDHATWIGALRDVARLHLQGWPVQPVPPTAPQA